VYVSTFERLVEIVTDVGVDPAPAAPELDALRSSLAHGADFERFLTKLRALGGPLGTALPRSEDDVNELPDAPVMEPGME
jgi:uncharacterized membrane protein